MCGWKDRCRDGNLRCRDGNLRTYCCVSPCTGISLSEFNIRTFVAKLEFVAMILLRVHCVNNNANGSTEEV